MSCTEKIIARITDPATFSTWQSQTAVSVAGITAATTDTDVSLLESDVTNTIACLQTKITDARSANSDITSLYQDYSAVQSSLQSQKAALGIAKDRAALLTHPEQKTTVYESWFPLHRPLNLTSFLVLLVTALFFFSIFVGLVSRQMGFSVNLAYKPFPGGLIRLLGALIALVGVSVIIYLASKK
jgi:hypothetical protein